MSHSWNTLDGLAFRWNIDFGLSDSTVTSLSRNHPTMKKYILLLLKRELSENYTVLVKGWLPVSLLSLIEAIFGSTINMCFFDWSVWLKNYFLHLEKAHTDLFRTQTQSLGVRLDLGSLGLDLGLDSGLNARDLRFTCDLQNTDFILYPTSAFFFPHYI